MSFETYQPIFNNYDEGRTLRAGKAGTVFSFDADVKPNKTYRLFTVGETTQSYLWKNEPDYHNQYALLTDSLDTEHAVRAQYCLNFSSEKPEQYVRRIYKKVLWQPQLSYLELAPVVSDFTAGFYAAADNLVIDRENGGYLHMSVEIRRKREGVSRHSNNVAPDQTVVIDFAEGSYAMTKFEKALVIDPDTTASVAVWIEGTGYSGEVYLEEPFLTASTGYNLLPDFSLPVHDKEHFCWLGQYFSRKEWPEFRVSLNGETVFEGEVFERCHTDSEWEIALPAERLQAHNELTYELISDYHDPMPYVIHECGVIEQAGGELSLVSASEITKVGMPGYILVRTGREDLTVTVELHTDHLTAPAQVTFAEAGLHAIKVDAVKVGEHAAFTLKAGDTAVDGEIARIVLGEDDGVVTGTGDMVYICQKVEDVEEYLSWYLSNHVGNQITARPTYRWSGTRVLNPAVWKLFTRLMDECSIRYVLMTDGREPVGLNTNPDAELLAGEHLDGLQSHELDGSIFYWGTKQLDATLTMEQYYDMYSRIYDEDPTHCWTRYAPGCYVFDGCGEHIYQYRDATLKRDMKVAAEYAVERFKQFHIGYTRHTGPSVYFKYLLQAGVPWVGAETMYSTMEILQSFLRGVKQTYRLPSVGVHHATQWSSTPHDAPEHVRRYRLALYSSYLQDADEINTEEGLWRFEEYYSHFHRFTDCCKQHTVQQQDFYRYVASHTRKGKFHTPMALIHGRCDGWLGFAANDNTWGWHDEEGLPCGTHTDAERSWDLLRVFYPQSEPGDALYFHECPTDRPVGYHSATPLGQVDTLPIENTVFENEPYKAAAFMGYNCADPADFERLATFVKQGGRLLLTRAHMTDTTALADLLRNDLTVAQTALSFTEGAAVFVENTVGGIPVSVCENTADGEVLATTDQGLPLVCRYALGDGEVVLVNALAFPAHKAIRPLYEQLLAQMTAAVTAAEPVWVQTDDLVEFAVYDAENGERHVYLLAVDWYNDPDALRRATVRVGDDRYEVALPFGCMVKGVAKDGVFAYPHSEDGEVLAVGDTVTVQGSGTVTFTVCKGGATKDVTVTFTEPTAAIPV